MVSLGSAEFNHPNAERNRDNDTTSLDALHPIFTELFIETLGSFPPKISK